MDSTTMEAGIDAMMMIKVIYDAIRSANEVDTSYDIILRKLDEFNQRMHAKEAEKDSDISDTKD
ncbi:MAG: hypothetical protein SFU99_14115 [Saprospiraceae bacterium]|nr:hypothetical protein [Saprospiraceae bacterium]